MTSATTIGLACCLPLVKAGKADSENPQTTTKESEEEAARPTEAEQRKEKPDQESKRKEERAKNARNRAISDNRFDLKRLLREQKDQLYQMFLARLGGSAVVRDVCAVSGRPPGGADALHPIAGLLQLKELKPQDFGPDTKTITAEKIAALVEKADGTGLDRFRKAEREYRELTKQPSPYDWSSRAELWYQFAADVLAPGTDEELANRWTQRIKAHPDRADLWAQAYLEQIRSRKPNFVDTSILRNYYSDDTIAPKEALTRMVLVLSSWANAGLPHDDRFRQTVWNRLLKTFREKDIPLKRYEQAFHAITFVFPDLWQGLSPKEQTALVNAMLDHQSASTLQILSWAAGVEPATRRRWFLSRPVRMVFERTGFQQALNEVKQASPTTALEDPSVAKWKHRIEIAIEGRWLEALKQLLAKTPFEAALLDDGIVWVGAPAKREAAARRLQEIKGLAESQPRLNAT